MSSISLIEQALTNGLSTGVVLAAFGLYYLRTEKRMIERERVWEERLAKREDDCAKERLEAGAKHEALQADMLRREIEVRDRERSDTLRVVTEQTSIVSALGRNIVDLTLSIQSRKSSDKLPAVR